VVFKPLATTDESAVWNLASLVPAPMNDFAEAMTRSRPVTVNLKVTADAVIPEVLVVG
jgi:hypothetical protein